MEIELQVLFDRYFQSMNVAKVPRVVFYEKYYRSRNEIYERIKCKRVSVDIKEVKALTDEALEICNYIGEKVELYRDDSNDPKMPIYPEYDPFAYPQYRFVECENYMTSKGLVKFNLDYVIRVARGYIRSDFEKDAYLNAPLISLDNYVWFVCPLEFYAGRIQEDYYKCYVERGDHELVSREEFHKLIKSHQPRGSQIDWKYLQEVIHKYNSMNIRSLKYG
jgi:hypothetical protein